MNKKLYKQICKFFVCGVIATVIDYVVFSLVRLCGIHYAIAQIISFLVATAFNYYISIKYVFVSDKSTKRKMIIFLIINVIGLGLTELLLYIGIDLLKMKDLIAKVFATAIVMVYSFISRKILLERK